MGILRNSASSNERSPSSLSKEENRRDEFLARQQQEFEAKREEFRKYLERAGVIDALTKVLVSLYEETEKPDDALEYVYKYLGGISENSKDTQKLEKELDSAKAQIAELEAKLVKCELEDASA